MGRIYGYTRVSSREQNEDRQLIALREQGIPDKNIFTDKQSGKDFERPEYKRLLKKLRHGDTLCIKSIDRLGRDYDELIRQWKQITKEIGADIYVIDIPLLDTRKEKNLLGTFISDLVLTLLSYIAENERINIRQRQAEGIAAAKKRGVKFGRSKRSLPENFTEVCEQWRAKQITLTRAAELCGMAKSTFHDKAKRMRAKTTE